MTRPEREQAPGIAGSLRQDLWKSLLNNRMIQIAGPLFAVVVLLCLLGPFFIPHSYESTQLAYGARPPSAEHWFGTDELGRDLLVRTLIGGRISIGVAFAATLVALLIGVTYGMIAGYYGRWIDAWMMRFVDTVYALPFTIITILLTAIWGRSLLLIFLAIGAVEWLTMARVVRGQTKALRRQNFVEAAIVSGVPVIRILRRHILPNLLSPVIVLTTLTIPAVILLESVISFLGLGIQPPISSWGILISEGAVKIDIYPWMLIFPALFFSLTIFSLNFIGDGLRDVLDPKDSVKRSFQHDRGE